jgi:NADH-quinone oxidoreductase subunit I
LFLPIHSAEEAIIMSKEYELVFESQEEAVFGKDKLLVPIEKVKDRLEFLHQHR